MMMPEILSVLGKRSEDGVVRSMVYPLSGTKHGLPFVVMLSVRYDGQLLPAWGTHWSLETATAKAASELCERIVARSVSPVYYRRLSRLGIGQKRSISNIQSSFPSARGWIGSTSSGWAAHPSARRARLSAILELIERHVILKAVATDISPSVILDDQRAWKVRRFSVPNGLSVSFFGWRGPAKTFVALAKVENDHEQVLGYGCDFGISQACEKAYLESVSAALWLSMPSELRGRLEIKTSNGLSPDCFREAHRIKAESRITGLLSSASSPMPAIDTYLTQNDFFFGSVDSRRVFGTKLPVSIVKAVCPRLQALFFDYWRNADLNPLALDESARRIETLHPIP